MRRSGTWVPTLLFALLPALPNSAVASWRPEGPYLGNVTGVAFTPGKPDTLYAATSGGGVWRSDDGGASWVLPGDEMTSRDVRWVEVDPGNAATVWAGTKGTGSGTALWRSIDRGASWEPVDDSYPGGRVQATGRRVAFAPAPSKTVFVPSTNLHYRSDDGGKTWHDFRVPNQDAYVMAVNPRDPKIVYAGGRGDTRNVSRSNDGGKTWRQVGIGLGKNSLSWLIVDPDEPSTLYAAGGTFTNVFKSTDQGDNWSALPVPAGSTSDLYALVLEPGPDRALWAATEDGLYRSADGGESWTRLDRGTGRYVVQALAVDPRDPRHLVIGSAGEGVFTSRDGGTSWTPSSHGLAAGWAEKLWGDPRSATLFVQMSTGLQRLDGGGWAEVIQPFASDDAAEIDGILFDAASPQTLYAFDSSKYWRSTDGGRRFQEVEQKGPSMRDMMKGNIDSAQFASLVQETGNPKTFYAGSWSSQSPGGAVWKTVDAGKKWTPSGTGLPSERVSLLRAGAPGTVFALVDGKTFHRTTNGGTSWSAAGSGLPAGKIHDFVVGRANPSTLFCAHEKGLYRSTDAGASFSRVGATTGIGDDEVEAVVIDPVTDSVYAGTFHGVFRSADGGASWTAVGGGMPNTDVRALAIAGSPPRLWAGTAGGSVASTELP